MLINYKIATVGIIAIILMGIAFAAIIKDVKSDYLLKEYNLNMTKETTNKAPNAVTLKIIGDVYSFDVENDGVKMQAFLPKSKIDAEVVKEGK